MKKRRTFDREFKQMVVELILHRDDLVEMAAEMGIRPDLIIDPLKQETQTFLF